MPSHSDNWTPERLRVEARCSTDSVMRHHAHAFTESDPGGDYVRWADHDAALRAVAAERDAALARHEGLSTAHSKVLTTANEQFHRANRLERERDAALARAERTEADVARLREALAAKPWPPSDDELREMLAHVVGEWWSRSAATFIRESRFLKPEDINGMYALRDVLAPYVARAALAQEPGA